MVEWETTRTELRALDAGVTLTIRTSEWRQTDGKYPLPVPVDATTAGTTRRFVVPDGDVVLRSLDGRRPVTDGTTLEADDYVLTFGRDLEAIARFSGPASVSRGDVTRVSFPGETSVTFGVRRRPETLPTVTVPDDPTGVAAGVSLLSVAHRTDDPARSHPTMRAHPPALELGDELRVPPSVAEASAAKSGGIELRVPPSLDALFVTAPLAYYLGADVTVDRSGDAATLLVDGREHALGRPPALADAANRLLREVFFLDCLARDVATERPLCQADVLDTLGLDRAALGAPTAVRLAHYLDAPRDELDSHLPDWHLSTSVEPTLAHVACLPHLLDRLSLVFRAEASPLTGRDRLDRSLADQYRGSAAVAPIDPRLGPGRIHGWLAPGEPIDAFKLSRAAYENRLAYRSQRLDAPLVTVVVNGEEMAAERVVADIYRAGSADHSIEVDVRESLTTAELAGVFAAPNDVVHYIGHCDEAGLRCPDGNLSAADIDRVRTRTFFLNACGSYFEGVDLIERGSVAGAVTLNAVLDEPAAVVGTAFARLLSHGFGIQRALDLARRRIGMGKDYAVVGDGTYTLTGRTVPPATIRLAGNERGNGPFEVTYEARNANRAGGSYRSPVAECNTLFGTATRATMDLDAVLELLDRSQAPVVYQGSLRWSDDLAASFREEHTADRRVGCLHADSR